MSDARLPEEVLREILKHRLDTNEESFCSSKRPPWLLKYDRRGRPHPGDLLRVSKRWLRVGTPLLYKAVFLWKLEHVKAVAQLLQAHPEVGKTIRYLRLEGSMGKDLAALVKNAPNIHTLYISIHLQSSHSVTGLRKAIPLCNPKSVYIYSQARRWMLRTRTRNINKAVVEARSLVLSALKKTWKEIETFGFCTDFLDTEWTNALNDLPSLKMVVADTHDAGSWIGSSSFAKVASKPSLEEIRCDGTIDREQAAESIAQAIANGRLPTHVTELKFSYIEPEVETTGMKLRRQIRQRQLANAAAEHANGGGNVP